MNITSLFDTEFNRNLFENNGENHPHLQGGRSFFIVQGKGDLFFYLFYLFIYFCPCNKD